MPRWLYALLLLVPAALAARLASLPDLLVFALSATGLIALAGLIGRATAELARRLGPRTGGLLNATFGNATELIIAAFATRHGLLVVVKASLTGSIIGNTLFVLGMSLFVGGLRYGHQSFDPRKASLNAAMMILAVAGLYLPATFARAVDQHIVVEELSVFVAAVLLLTYIAYLIYIFQARGRAQDSRSSEVALPERALWSTRTALGVLAGSAAGAAICSELLVWALEPTLLVLGWSELFIGVIIIALVGNAAEHFSALQMAWRDRLDVTFAITAGSGTQIALFVAPVLVLVSRALGHPMDLIFTPLELAILVLATAIFAYISLDGEANWLEGIQLFAVYVVAASAFFLLPVHHQ
jgi:Ca2+:H+ antiporter